MPVAPFPLAMAATFEAWLLRFMLMLLSSPEGRLTSRSKSTETKFFRWVPPAS
jgi:hypothetical protein